MKKTVAKVFPIILLLLIPVYQMNAQTIDRPDNLTYTNPIIHADYSDPDAIRVGDDYYLTSSSFGHFPGLPILHSKNLVDWEIIGHAALLYPYPEFDKPQHGNAIFAPSIRYHDGEFYIYYGDPDRGVFMTKAQNAAGPWEPLKLIKKVTGWIDCCPFWDDDDNAYMVHAFANSRCGIKSILAINRMSPDGTKIIDDGILVFNGQKSHPTIEGPKLYKKNGYYYIFAPAGGVKPGWQTVLRSKNIWGPYEDKTILEQGKTKINGPHQGAWVTTVNGEDWFIHFQDRYAYGRIVHLQPMRWENDWPIIGIDLDGNGIGEPVAAFRTPDSMPVNQNCFAQTSDDFSNPNLGLQWQWEANVNQSWYSLKARPGFIRLNAVSTDAGDKNQWTIGNLLMQKFPAAVFSAIAKLDCSAMLDSEKAGLMIFGYDYSYISIEKKSSKYRLAQYVCIDAPSGSPEKIKSEKEIESSVLYMKISVRPEDSSSVIPKVFCDFSYSIDNENFIPIGATFIARESRWVGAKCGLFAVSSPNKARTGFVDVDWIHFNR